MWILYLCCCYCILLFLLLLLFYGCGEVPCCYVLCHFSNVTICAASLYSGVDECLGIDPAVEFGGVAEPFHQSLRSSTYLTTLQIPRGTLYRRVPTPSAAPVRRRCRPALHRDRPSIGTRVDRRDEPRVS